VTAETNVVHLALAKASRALRLDGWSNPLTWPSTLAAKFALTRFRLGRDLTDQELEDLYVGDDFAARIVGAIPSAALRQGITIEGDPDGELAALVDELDVCGKVGEAWTWGRLYGGGAIVLGFADGPDAALPLDEEKIAPDSLRFLLVVDKRDLDPVSWVSDVTDPRFGEPELYRVTLTAGRAGYVDQPLVHASRVIRFGGVLTSRRRKDQRNGWDDSVLRRCWEILRDAGLNWQSAGNALSDLSQAVYGVKDMAKMIQAGQRERLQDLMGDMDLRRSASRAIMVDAEHERFEQVGKANISAVPPLLEQTWKRVAAAAEMPLTVLMGQSPAGLSATGESDTRGWYDTIQAERQRVAVPALTRLLRIIARSAQPKGVDPDEIWVSFPSLYQLTPAEESTLRNQQAQTDATYISAGVLLPQEVAISRFGRGTWSAETEVNADLREALRKAEEEAMKAEAERAAEDAKNPPAPPPQLAPFAGKDPAKDEGGDVPEPGAEEPDEADTGDDEDDPEEQ
jgi:phage-related protein (TIGR01555 family)